MHALSDKLKQSVSPQTLTNEYAKFMFFHYMISFMHA